MNITETEYLKKAKAKAIGFDATDEKECLRCVKEIGNSIRHVKNPSLEIQLAAVGENGHAVRHIENPSERVKLAAIKNTVYSIREVENPTEEMQLRAVNHNGFLLEEIKNPTDRVIVAAVKEAKDVIKLINIDSLSQATKEILVYLL